MPSQPFRSEPDIIPYSVSASRAALQYGATYGYDGLRRIATANVTLPGSAPALSFAYCYDALGNLTLIDGKLTLVNGDWQQNCYDADGNLLHLDTPKSDCR